MWTIVGTFFLSYFRVSFRPNVSSILPQISSKVFSCDVYVCYEQQNWYISPLSHPSRSGYRTFRQGLKHDDVIWCLWCHRARFTTTAFSVCIGPAGKTRGDAFTVAYPAYLRCLTFARAWKARRMRTWGRERERGRERDRNVLRFWIWLAARKYRESYTRVFRIRRLSSTSLVSTSRFSLSTRLIRI